MKVTVLFFGISSDLTGQNKLEFEIEKSISIARFKTLLTEKYPVLNKINSYAIAVNEVYATDEVLIKNADTVAIIPPVSGG